jgi:methyl-accepting chemotaxis protein
VKIRTKILIPVTILLLVACGVISLIGYSNMENAIENVMKVRTQATLNEIIFQQQLAEQTRDILMTTWSRDYLRIARSLAMLISRNPQQTADADFIEMADVAGIEEIHLINREGLVYAGTNPELFGHDYHADQENQAFLQILSDSSYELAMEPRERSSDGVLFQYIGVAVKATGELLVIGIQPRELEEILQEMDLQKVIAGYPYQEGEYAYILDPVEKVCTQHVSTKLIGYDMTTLDFAMRIFDLQNGNFTYIWQEREIYTSFKTTEAGIIVTAVPTESYYAQLIPIRRALILSTVLTLLLVFLIIMLILRYILSPLGVISQSLQNIAQGEADLTRRLVVKNRDEIGEVADNFNEFMANLQALISRIQKAVNRTEEIKNKLLIQTEQTAESSRDISTNIKALDSGISTVSDQLSDSANAIEEIDANTDSFDRLISSQAAMMEQTTASMTQMLASIENIGEITKLKMDSTKELKDSAEEGRRRIEETSDDFSGVAVKISSIQEMTEAINAIASQTDMLSMNAAIEAAHAGDSGKGFAVVAEEIRKLAETAGSTSKEISTLITEITSGIVNTSNNMKKMIETFESIRVEIDSTVEAYTEIGNSVMELTVGGRQIMDSTQEVNNVTNEVSSGSKEIHAGIGVTNRSLVTIRESAGQSTESIQRISVKTTEVSEAMADIESVSGKLNSITNDLVEDIKRFITE